MVLVISILGPGAITTEFVLTSCAKFQDISSPNFPFGTRAPPHILVMLSYGLLFFPGYLRWAAALSGAMITVPLQT